MAAAGERLGKLSSVTSSLARTRMVRAILEPMVAGEQRDPRALAVLTHGNVRGGRAAIEKAHAHLTGWGASLP